MQFDQLLDEREPNTAAFKGSALGALNSMKALEQVGELRSGNARTGIRDNQLDL